MFIEGIPTIKTCWNAFFDALHTIIPILQQAMALSSWGLLCLCMDFLSVLSLYYGFIEGILDLIVFCQQLLSHSCQLLVLQ